VAKTEREILEEITEIFRDVLDNDEIVLRENTTADDIEEWDSLNHIQLVVSIEKHFHVKFPTNEIQKWKRVGDMCASVHSKLSSAG
jgi:acyl carrier protein